MSALLVAKDKQRTRQSAAAASVGAGGRLQEKTKDWQVGKKEIQAPKSWSTLSMAQQESHPPGRADRHSGNANAASKQAPEDLHLSRKSPEEQVPDKQPRSKSQGDFSYTILLLNC